MLRLGATRLGAYGAAVGVYAAMGVYAAVAAHGGGAAVRSEACGGRRVGLECPIIGAKLIGEAITALSG